VGRNISDAQILSQLDVLNKDFNRLNTDAVNTPSEFVPVAGSLDIEFVLARQDPDGQPTNGIVRVHGNRDQWPLGLEAQFKALSYWPAEHYLNIWVIKFQSYLGYAQFPVSSGLEGLEDENNNRLTDGVIIDYRVFGVGSSDPDYNLGRTTTHEVGHFLGLRHIWGDEDGCDGTDYVDDTPNQEDETYNCPSNPQTDCDSHKMFQNYMDYTDDVCMNLFTQGQIERMIAVLENSPRRLSLLTSPGLQEPAPGTIDVELTEIENPVSIICDQTPELKFTVANLSEEAITSLTIKVTINSFVSETEVNFTTTPFTTIAEIKVTGINLVIGENTLAVKILNVNGLTDPNMANNELQTSVQVLHPECEMFALYTNAAGTPVITFELMKAMPVDIQVISLTGQVAARVQYDRILNETVPLPMPARMKGVYVVRLRIGAVYYTRKVYLYP
ncbi:MAG TPA: zinc metalloprotease, partial [Cyclobacteriaceae bacterium]|nr:zinc metalloprotease [Cyclobacteriaceae bacterium]